MSAIELLLRFVAWTLCMICRREKDAWTSHFNTLSTQEAKLSPSQWPRAENLKGEIFSRLEHFLTQSQQSINN